MLTIKDLNFSYSLNQNVLTDVNLTIEKGKKTALIGSNGSGKTTLFLLCSGILHSDSGMISINNKPVLSGKFNPDTAYLFQSPDDQLFSATLFEDVAFGPLNMGLKKDNILQVVTAALKQVDCQHLAQKSPHHLSGGEKRMAALATLLSMNPRLILCDEPTANLDNRNRRKVINLIQKMSQTLFISSHDLEFLLETCEEVILLDAGKVIASGPIREIMSNDPLMSSCGLEKPHSLTQHKIQHHS